MDIFALIFVKILGQNLGTKSCLKMGMIFGSKSGPFYGYFMAILAVKIRMFAILTNGIMKNIGLNLKGVYYETDQ